MDATAAHEIESNENAAELVGALAAIDLSKLSFVQLMRLQKSLAGISADIAKETERRSVAGDSADTVAIS